MRTTCRCLLTLVLVVLVASIAAAPALAKSQNTTVKGVVQGHGYYAACHHWQCCSTTKLVGATVTVLGSSPLLQPITGQCGAYCLTGPLVQPPYQCGVPVRACATWYEPQTVYVRPCPGGTRTQNFCLLVKATTLTGTVLGCKHHAICGANVCAAGCRAVTDKNGHFTLGGLRLMPQSPYTATVSHCGNHTNCVPFVSAPGGSVSIGVTLT